MRRLGEGGGVLLADTYADVVAVLARVDDDASYAPTGCTGWSVRDLTFHCTMDAQRALVALHTPVDVAADTDAVGYWEGWGSDPDGDAAGRRFARVVGSMFSRWPQLRELHAETSAAAVHAASQAPTEAVVVTQGHALRVDDLLSTLVVEATIHHLDLVTHLGLPGPSAEALVEVRRVLEALAGQAFPLSWSDADVARVGTGRAAPPQGLGPLAQRLPLLG